MDIRKLQRAIVDGLEDVKARDIAVFNTEHLSPLFERVIVASGTSNRQTKALASSVREAVKSRGLPVLSVEGADNGEWIIVDCGAAVAHIMQPAIRDYYRLEEIWGGKPVKMKVDGAAPGADPLARAAAKPAGKAVARAAADGSAKAARRPAKKKLPRQGAKTAARGTGKAAAKTAAGASLAARKGARPVNSRSGSRSGSRTGSRS
ncbi:MAG: ribosome silencing factor [Ideonella sp.]|nr:ribosome silencing factor [Ideonella sp.]MCC7455697.1 ribosome silencing factor [Nitrospira sp.]